MEFVSYTHLDVYKRQTADTVQLIDRLYLYFQGKNPDLFEINYKTNKRLEKMCIRDSPYSVRHLPWYINNDNMSKEELYYLGHIKTLTNWSKQNKVKTEMCIRDRPGTTARLPATAQTPGSPPS